jgi:Flp pilus assembly protein TadG
MKRCRSNRRQGVALPLAALFIVFLAGMVAFGVDCGVIVLARTQLQAAADAAAIAGADTLANGTSAAQTAAQTIGQANKAAGANVSIVTASDVQLGTWSSSTSTFTALSGSSLSNSTAVQVTTHLAASRGNGLTLFFAPVFGKTSVDLSATAVAKCGISCGAFIGLNSATIKGGAYTDSYDSSSGAYNAASAGPKGNVCSNGDINLNGGSYIHGDAHPGPSHTASGGTISGSTTPLSTALTETAINFSGPSSSNNNANIPLTSGGKTAFDSSTRAFKMSSGDTLSLPAGTYYFSSIKLSGNSSITVSAGTKIYCTGDIDLSGGSLSNTSTIPSNLMIYCGGSSCDISSQVNLYACVYAPSTDVKKTGGSDLFGVIVAASITTSGNGGMHYDTSLGGVHGAAAQLVK